MSLLILFNLLTLFFLHLSLILILMVSKVED